MSQFSPSPNRYDPHSSPSHPVENEPDAPRTTPSLVKWAVLAVPLALVLIPTVWGYWPGEIARWHDAAAKEKYLNGDLPGAIAEVDKALAISDRSPDRYALRAKFQHDQENYVASLEDWNSALQLTPDDRNLLLQRSGTLQHLGRFKEAVDDLKAIKRFDDEHGVSLNETFRALDLNNLAYAQGVANMDLREALAQSQEVVKLLGGDAFILEQIGYLHVLRKDWKRAKLRLLEAVAAFEKEISSLQNNAAVTTDKSDTTNSSPLLSKSQDRLAGVQFHLARVNRELNDPEQAARFEELAAAWRGPERALRDRLPTKTWAWAFARQVAVYVDTRGYVQYRLGDYISAREDLELAAEIVELDYERKDERFQEDRLNINDLRVYKLREEAKKKGVAVILYHRALVYEKLGLAEMAAEDLRRVKEVYGYTPGDDLF